MPLLRGVEDCEATVLAARSFEGDLKFRGNVVVAVVVFSHDAPKEQHHGASQNEENEREDRGRAIGQHMATRYC